MSLAPRLCPPHVSAAVKNTLECTLSVNVGDLCESRVDTMPECIEVGFSPAQLVDDFLLTLALSDGVVEARVGGVTENVLP
jgi:hypothetical protein